MRAEPRDLMTGTPIEINGWEDYELLDSGGFRKLERFGDHRLIRTEPAALWKPALDRAEWENPDAEFSIGKGQSQGTWIIREGLPLSWEINYKALKVKLSITKSRHIGIFPEQRTHWDWIAQKVKATEPQITVLNLFGYTGLSTLAAANAGALVTHVDASRGSVERAKNNFELSGLSGKPIRWIVDDALKFVQREIRRGSHYDAIIMDPPNFGRGPKGEVWKFDQAITILLSMCAQLLSKNPRFLIITAYNNHYQDSDLGAALSRIMEEQNGILTYGNLIQTEKSAGRKIDQAIYAKWEGKV